MRGRILVLLPLVLIAAACGSGSGSNGEAKKTASEVVADAQKAALGASAVHVSGSIVEGALPLTVDLHLKKGRGKGRLSERGLRFDLVRIGDKAYVKGSEAFLRRFAGASGAALLRGKWLTGPASRGQFAALVPLTDMSKFFTSALGSHGTLANDGAMTYHGRKVVAIRDTTRGGTLYVAAVGTPYPVAISGAKGHGSISFDNWDEKVAIAAPNGAVDLGTLGG